MQNSLWGSLWKLTTTSRWKEPTTAPGFECNGWAQQRQSHLASLCCYMGPPQPWVRPYGYFKTKTTEDTKSETRKRCGILIDSKSTFQLHRLIPAPWCGQGCPGEGRPLWHSAPAKCHDHRVRGGLVHTRSPASYW